MILDKGINDIMLKKKAEKKNLDIIYAIDTSASMSFDGLIDVVNDAMEQLSTCLKKEARLSPTVQVYITTYAFGGPDFDTEEVYTLCKRTKIEDYQYQRITSVSGSTPLAEMLEQINHDLSLPHFNNDARAPIIVIVTDGEPNENDKLNTQLELFKRHPVARKALKTVIAMGNFDLDRWSQFTPLENIYKASNAKDIVSCIKKTSTLVKQASKPSLSIKQESKRLRIKVPSNVDIVDPFNKVEYTNEDK